MSREDFPLEPGDSVEIDGETLTFVDYPTDGPLFHDEQGCVVQLETSEAEKHV